MTKKLGESIYIYTTKGGVGKSALTINYAAYLSAAIGLKVAVVDFDDQQNCFEYLQYPSPKRALRNFFSDPDRELTLYDYLWPHSPSVKEKASDPLQFAVCPQENDIGTLDLFAVNRPSRNDGSNNLDSHEDRMRFYAKLNRLREEYDYVFFDTGPTPSSLTRALLSYVDHLYLVFGFNDIEERSIDRLIDLVLEEELVPDNKIRAFWPTRHSLVKKSSKINLDKLIGTYSDALNVPVAPILPESNKFVKQVGESGLYFYSDEKLVRDYAGEMFWIVYRHMRFGEELKMLDFESFREKFRAKEKLRRGV